MFAESAAMNRRPLELVLLGAFQIALVLVVSWFGTRHDRAGFHLGRIAVLTLLCLATGLPFALVAYWLYPWDWNSNLVRTVVILPPLVPLATAIALSFSGHFRKQVRRRRPDSA